MDNEAIDLQGCEHCNKEFPIEQMTMMVDCWYCQPCYDEWKKHFDACDHEWQPSHDEHGDAGKYCGKCAGFVTNETYARDFTPTPK